MSLQRTASSVFAKSKRTKQLICTSWKLMLRMIHHPGPSRTKPGTQRDAITHQTSLPVGINQLRSSMAFWETCFGSNKSFGVTAECNPFLWQQRGCLACTLSCGKDGLKAANRGAEWVWMRPTAPRHREVREVFPTSAYEFSFHPRWQKRFVTRASRHNGEPCCKSLLKPRERICGGLNLVDSLGWISDPRGASHVAAYPLWLHRC